MKSQNFTWGWMNRPRQPDTFSTRELTARRMRCYRRARDHFKLERIGRGVYKVTHLKTHYGEYTTFSTVGA